MDIDRYTKFLLTIIAFALMLNALNPWIAPQLLHASTYEEFGGIQSGLEYIADAIRNYRQ